MSIFQLPTVLLDHRLANILMKRAPDWFYIPTGASCRTVAQDRRRAAKARAVRRAKKHGQA
jgi:hypothetical protein